MTTLAFCKPFRVLCQFSPSGDKTTLADFITTPDIYPAGRLDYDSEGLLILTSNGRLQHRISTPGYKLAKTYWVQVEGTIDETALKKLRNGVELKDGLTAPAQAERIKEPAIWPRKPAIRERKNIPTSWLSLTLHEGRNRQVRRMTAAAGFPTLRLIRSAIGPIRLDDLQPGEFRPVDVQQELAEILRLKPDPATRRSPPRHPRPHKSNRPERSSRQRN